MRLQLAHGDITVFAGDAIVNAANSSLLGGGGVDGAIHRAGGPAILAECRALRAEQYRAGLPAGKSVATGAGELAARWVIHTVGPVYSATDDRTDTLRSCYRTALAVAAEVGARTIAVPLVSAGAYRWPVDSAIRIAVDEARTAPHEGVVTLMLFSEQTFRRAGKIIPG